MFKRLALLAVAALLVGCVHPQPMQPPKTADRATIEEYAVYSVVLSQYPLLVDKWDREQDQAREIPEIASYLKENPLPTTRQLVIWDTTLLDISSLPPSQWAKDRPHFEKATADDFVKKNSEQVRLRPWFTVKAQVILVSKTGLYRGGNLQEYWSRFYKLYPRAKGYIHFSRVGFNADYTQALLSFGYMWQEDAGAGWLVVLAKKDGEWVIQDRAQTWCS